VGRAAKVRRWRRPKLASCEKPTSLIRAARRSCRVIPDGGGDCPWIRKLSEREQSRTVNIVCVARNGFEKPRFPSWPDLFRRSTPGRAMQVQERTPAGAEKYGKVLKPTRPFRACISGTRPGMTPVASGHYGPLHYMSP